MLHFYVLFLREFAGMFNIGDNDEKNRRSLYDVVTSL